jgi:hypothetical protein
MAHELEQYNETAERIEAAYTAFRSQYVVMHPQPERPAKAARSDMKMRIALLVMVIAGMVVSASRTVVVFGIGKGIVIGGAASVMLEGAAVVMSYYYTRERYRQREDKAETSYIGKYLYAGSLFAVIVMISGNIQDVMGIDGFAQGAIWTALQFPISLLVALSAPIMVFLSGHVLALLAVLDLKADRLLEDDWRSGMAKWEEDLTRSWNANKRSWNGVVSVEPVNPLRLPDVKLHRSNLPANLPSDFTRPSKKTQQTIAWFVANPEHLNTPSRELVEKIGVSHMTIHKAQQQLKAELSQNENQV